ncbi:hypothetical protein GCM10009836_34390 [Pseudonocardia ailaonensis]|uniref:Thiolase C-terminal domain-containing protein n=2 Tax=Pseudonocardia ailaonensis TaxID=367279 RepID=A0ABN2N515_9PSEU
MSSFEHDTVISGIGQTPIGRRLSNASLNLTLDACRAAVADAGLELSDIDGLFTWPGAVNSPMPGFSGPASEVVQDALRLRLNVRQSVYEGGAQLTALINACLMVAAGLCRHALVYRTTTESSAQGGGRRRGTNDGGGDDAAAGNFGWLAPFGVMSIVNSAALMAMRHFETRGTSRETLAAVATTQRRHAAMNPEAVLRSAMTLDDYLGARMISTPLGLFDCDLPVDGATAFVVSHRDYAPDVPGGAVFVEASGTASRERQSWEHIDDVADMSANGAAAQLWSRTSLRPEDVDVAMLYDGFSIFVPMWLEAFGFCKVGGAAEFIGDGSPLSHGGRLPTNTHGGQLSAGRTHGFGHIREAVVQLRGSGGERQVRSRPRVALVANGGGTRAACLLLRAADHE